MEMKTDGPSVWTRRCAVRRLMPVLYAHGRPYGIHPPPGGGGGAEVCTLGRSLEPLSQTRPSLSRGSADGDRGTPGCRGGGKSDPNI